MSDITSASQQLAFLRPWQFTLRTLLALVLVAGVLSFSVRGAPQLGVFLLAATPAPVLTWWLIQRTRHRHRCGLAAWSAVFAAWVLLYVASTGPAAAFLHWSGATSSPNSKLYEQTQTVYAPVIWAHHNFDIVSAPLNWYLEYWENRWPVP